MQKEYSIIVPDEMYVESFTGNTWMSWTYTGPETLRVKINEASYSAAITDDDAELISRDDAINGTYVIELDANTYPAVADYLVKVSSTEPHEFIYEDEINPDGTIYKKLANPLIHDYYELQYNFASTNTREDGRVQGPWIFNTKIISNRTPELEKFEEKFNLIKQKLTGIGLESADQTIFDNFISAGEEYLETMKTYYPWKYAVEVGPTGPVVPVRLLKVIQELGL